MDVDFSAFEQLVESRVKNRLDAYDKRFEDKYSKFVEREEMNERLAKKASSHEYGYLYKEIADFRIKLSPLMDRKLMLRGLIDKVVGYEINITHEKDFSKQIE